MVQAAAQSCSMDGVRSRRFSQNRCTGWIKSPCQKTVATSRSKRASRSARLASCWFRETNLSPRSVSTSRERGALRLRSWVRRSSSVRWSDSTVRSSIRYPEGGFRTPTAVAPGGKRTHLPAVNHGEQAAERHQMLPEPERPQAGSEGSSGSPVSTQMHRAQSGHRPLQYSCCMLVEEA